MRLRRPLIVLAAVAAAVAALPTPAEAHPLGNFSINEYAGLTLRPSRVDVLALADIAEIPTLQEKPQVDANDDDQLSVQELSAYADSECRSYADALAVTVGNNRLTWTITLPTYETKPGAGGLSTSRLSCHLSAPATLTGQVTLRVTNNYRSGRVGWHELTAAGDGVRLDSPLPATSVSHELTEYPRDLLSSAPDVRTATIQLGDSAAAAATPRLAAVAPGWLTKAQTRLESAVGGHLTPVVVTLAFLLALLLGAAHAVLPGHGKTVMAAYFAGSRGRIRDALAVGGTVTLSHTGGVLAVGLLLTTSTTLIGEDLLSWLAAASGLLVTVVGLGMLTTALRSRRLRPGGPDHSHSPGDQRPTNHNSEPPHDHPGRPRSVFKSFFERHSHHHSAHSHLPDAHSHLPDAHEHPHDGHSHLPDGHKQLHGGHEHPHHQHQHQHQHGIHEHSSGEHSHSHHDGRRPGGRFGLAGIGLAGGLVPSPSALVVLLGAIGMGRTVLGLLLVLAYGIGMAGTLTAVGLLLVHARRRLGDFAARTNVFARLTRRISAGAPTATATLVVLVGLGIGLRAVA